MRFMLKAMFDTHKANTLAREGNLGKVIQSIVDDLKPETAYFTEDHGKRTAYLFINLNEPSEIPFAAEPWFNALDAHVELHPAMVADDLKKASSGIEQSAKKYSSTLKAA